VTMLTVPGLRPVSRETQERLARYVVLLQDWQRRINLVSPGTLDQIWKRHIVDCVQIFQLAPEARVWADLGAGGGLPGLVLACVLAETPGSMVHLIESNHKKAAFLRAVTVELALPATIHAERIETVIPKLPPIEIVTARALAPLTELVGYSNSLLKKGTVGLFPKGRDYQTELTAALRSWHVSYQLHESLTEAGARIVELRWKDV
jgi:16S rRNA (guanine527-N7)-methyltransferase